MLGVLSPTWAPEHDAEDARSQWPMSSDQRHRSGPAPADGTRPSAWPRVTGCPRAARLAEAAVMCHLHVTLAAHLVLVVLPHRRVVLFLPRSINFIEMFPSSRVTKENRKFLQTQLESSFKFSGVWSPAQRSHRLLCCGFSLFPTSHTQVTHPPCRVWGEIH